MMRARYAALPAALLALSLAACSAPEGQSTQGGSASADTLNIACSQQEDFCQAIVTAYTRETGQKATYVRLGAGEVLARLETNPGEFDVWSGGQAENHLVANDKGKIEIDLTVERGRGYVSAAQNKGFDDEIGRIPIDSIYSPVLKVSYKVEATRVEQRTDFDKLIVDVEVKPSTTPRDALASAGKTLVELFGLCVDLNNEAEGIEIGPAPVVETQSSDLQRPITILNLPARSQNCLQREGIRTIGELIQRSEADLLDIRNFGAKSIEDVKDELAKLDLRLKDSPAGFVSTYGAESYTMQFSDDSQG